MGGNPALLCADCRGSGRVWHRFYDGAGRSEPNANPDENLDENPPGEQVR
ncbi:hypothetical protein KDH_71080 [Dictyobacter sp. S3.2.2.5]|uniref:Uncharacterized protein n=1 Tax=Dictyobacter halimunensis TaxID=3026934 RepID=A0ABQ6G1A1_9CHLR|nr:hypothetical protein KDH_71080 [Dictyobacter sp. S3.2.2.5]